MCKKPAFLISLLVLLIVANAHSAELVGHWKFDEGSGNVAADSSGNGNNGTVMGNAAWVAGQMGSSALNFDDSDDIVIIAHDPSLDIEDAMTISLWVNTPNVVAPNHMVTKQPSGTAPDNYPGNYEFRVKDNTIQFLHQTSESTDYTLYISTSQITAGQWHHAVVSIVEGGTVEFYLDGVSAGSLPQLGAFGVLNNDSLRIGGRKDSHFFNGTLDDVHIYNGVLTDVEINLLMTTGALTPELASNPTPADQATDVPREVVLGWEPGEFAAATDGHKVYFGRSFDEVNDATGGIAQTATYYTPPQRLDFDTTYYWRVDEVNAPPTSHVEFKGNVWSFTTEPIGYPIDGANITATASSTFGTSGPEKTIDGSGLDGSDLHSTNVEDMWLSDMMGPQPTWIEYQFDKVHKLHAMRVWNQNQMLEPAIGYGFKDVTIEHSIDGIDYATLGTTHEFARGPGMAGYAASTTVDFAGAAAKYVRLTANSNWGSILTQYGLSEIRFLSIPVFASAASPNSGATGVAVDAALSFRAGREAASHDVYLSTDEQAVMDGTAGAVTVTEPSYAASLDLASTYYWRVDEVNDAETPSTWGGEVWDFTTQEYIVVEDFESYNDIEAGQEGSNLIYTTWADGYENPAANGSTIGYTVPFEPTMESSTVFDGSQSVPLSYNNTAALYSEVTANVADLQAGRDWSKHGIKALTLRFFGDPNNSVNDRMYVKINGAKVPYDGDAENLKRLGWQMWYVDLASTGADLSNVTELAIGFERIGSLGGQGKVLLDGIRLYSHDRQLVTPVDPGAGGLQAHYEFEGNTSDSSGNARNGTAMGNPTFAAGQAGQAMNLDGVDDYVNIDGYKGILADANGVQHEFTLCAWIKTTADGEIITWGTNAGGQRMTFRVDTVLRVEHGSGNIRGTNGPDLRDDQWHHVAATIPQGAGIMDVTLYVDGYDVTPNSTTTAAFNLTASADVSIGRRATNDDRYFIGSIDDARIYDRVLSQEEIFGLAGGTIPFDKPF